MSQGEDLVEWNTQALNVVQALLGVISANFRMVSLGREKNRWVINFFLESALPDDLDEIEDFEFEFEALQTRPIDFIVKYTVTNEKIIWPDPPVRVLFRRRESDKAPPASN